MHCRCGRSEIAPVLFIWGYSKHCVPYGIEWRRYQCCQARKYHSVFFSFLQKYLKISKCREVFSKLFKVFVETFLIKTLATQVQNQDCILYKSIAFRFFNT